MTTTSSNNFTGLYGSGTATVNPNTAYGNANVVGLLSAGTDGANTVGNITAAGNVFVGGDLSVVGTIYGANIAGNIVVPGANTSVLYNVDGNVGANTNFSYNYVTSALSLTGTANITGNVISTGNVTGNYFIGNGSQLTGLPATYGNANVVTLLSNFGSNSISTTGNITGGLFSGNGAGLTNINAGNIVGSYGNANVSNFLANGFGSNSISTTGNISAGNVLLGDLLGAGNVTATGNVTGANIIGNGSGLSAITGANVTGTVANATYATSAGSAGSANTAVTVTGNAQANITSVGTLTSLSVSGNTTTGNMLTGGIVSATGNITGNYFIGNGSQLTGLPATYGNADVSNFLANGFGSNTITTTGNIGGGNITAISNISAGGNVTGAYFFGNGSALTGIVATATPGGANTQIQFNQAGVLAGDAGMTYTYTTGNVNLSTVSGNVNMGNLVVAQNNIKNVNDVVQTSSPPTYRITVGSGYNGLFTNTYDPLSAVRGAQLLVQSKYDVANTDTNQSIRQVASNPYFDLQGGTLNNANRRMGAGAFVTNVGNGTMTLTTGASVGSVNGTAGVVVVGNAGSGIANATVSHGAGLQASIIAASGGTIGNAFGIFATPQINSGGNITNLLAVSSNFSGTTGFTTPTTAIGYYMPGTTATYGISNGNGVRAATNYYFLKNDDNVAQVQLGSLRFYNEYDYQSATTSGSLAIDKNNGQVQQINLTGTITAITFSNFVTSASDSVNTDEQADTVTMIFNQGTTGGYDVSFPSGSTYKYAGNVRTLSSTAANSVSLCTVTAVRLSGTTTYLLTVSPVFVS